MADQHAEATAPHVHGEMNISEQAWTWSLFMGLTKWLSLAMAVLILVRRGRGLRSRLHQLRRDGGGRLLCSEEQGFGLGSAFLPDRFARGPSAGSLGLLLARIAAK